MLSFKPIHQSHVMSETVDPMAQTKNPTEFHNFGFLQTTGYGRIQAYSIGMKVM